ncbi:MAG TPA: HlyD family efflux transporter periplasmic adaptor subunit [Thermoanaerobaculia bacterium]
MNSDIRPAPPALLGWIVTASAIGLAAAAVFLLIVTQDETVDALGVIRPSGDVVQVASESMGRVTTVNVRPGQHVRAGDTLFVLDDEKSREERQAAQQLLDAEQMQIAAVERMIELAAAELRASREARLLEAGAAEVAVNRTRELVAKGIESEAELQRLAARMNVVKKELEIQSKAGQVRIQDLQTRRAEHLKAAADLRAHSRVLDVDLDKAAIRAPVDGQVTWTAARHPGEWIQRGATVAHVAHRSASPVFVARIANKAIGDIAIGQNARVEIDAFPSNRHGYIHGRVAEIAPEADGDHRDYTVVIDLESRPMDRPSRLKFGMTGRAAIVTGRQRLIAQLSAR